MPTNFEEPLKAGITAVHAFNPNHDQQGRFSEGEGGGDQAGAIHKGDAYVKNIASKLTAELGKKITVEEGRMVVHDTGFYGANSKPEQAAADWTNPQGTYGGYLHGTHGATATLHKIERVDLGDKGFSYKIHLNIGAREAEAGTKTAGWKRYSQPYQKTFATVREAESHMQMKNASTRVATPKNREIFVVVKHATGGASVMDHASAIKTGKAYSWEP